MAKENKGMTPFQQMEKYLHQHYTFEHNVVLDKIEYKSPVDSRVFQLDDFRLNSLFAELQRKTIHVHRSTLENYLFSDSWEQFDPFKRYFDALPEWKPGMEDYISKLASTIKVKADDLETWNSYLRKWLIALVGCATIEEITNQTVLVLIGNQGIGKTKWIEALVPDQLKSYYY